MAIPAERVRMAVARWGIARVVEQCATILRSDPRRWADGFSLDVAMVLGELTDREWLAGGRPPGNAWGVSG